MDDDPDRGHPEKIVIADNAHYVSLRTTYLQASQLRRKRVTPFFAGVSYRQLGRSVGRAILARAGVLERACVRRAERSACEAGHGDSRHLAARSFRLSTVASWTKIVVT